MARSLWKGPFADGYLSKRAKAPKGAGRDEVIKIWSRRSTILPQFVGLTFGVHNGHKHIPVYITDDMIGHKFGDFAPKDIEGSPQERMNEAFKVANERTKIFKAK